MLLNYGVGEDSLRVPWTARRSNQSILKEISPEYHWKDWCWSWNSNILATWCEELTPLKRPWCWKRLKAGREGDDRRWDGWRVSPTRWTWVWASYRSWWRTGKPGMLHCMLLQWVGYNWATEQQQIVSSRVGLFPCLEGSSLRQLLLRLQSGHHVVNFSTWWGFKYL